MFELVSVLAHVLVVSKVVVGYTTRSYDLEVPGSKPIRIIEADPIWDQRHPPRRDDRAEFEHRTITPTTVKTDKFMDRDDTDYQENSHKLKDFLNSYAEKIKNKRHYSSSEEEGEEDDEINLSDYSTESEEVPSTEKPKHEKSKSWNLIHIDKIPPQNNKWGHKQSQHGSFHSNPDDKKEWVSMEAVPWSMSKISKWQSKPQNTEKLHYSQNGYYERPGSDYDQEIDYGVAKPSFLKPYKPAEKPNRPQSTYYNDDDDDDDDYYNKRPTPSYSRPSATYGQKVHVHQSSWSNKFSPPHKHDSKCNHQGDIITDGQPPNFPDHNTEYGNRRRGSNGDFLPASHPFKGDVLPPLNDGKVNMTTSHGGLLQVESTFQSVDEAQKAYVKKQKNRRKPISIKLKPAISGQFANQQALPPRLSSMSGLRPVQYAVDNRGDSPDTSSVLAAVGAGMIPAGMALLVPMAMNGRKRRELLLAQHQNVVTSSPYADQIEITLPRSL